MFAFKDTIKVGDTVDFGSILPGLPSEDTEWKVTAINGDNEIVIEGHWEGIHMGRITASRKNKNHKWVLRRVRYE